MKLCIFKSFNYWHILMSEKCKGGFIGTNYSEKAQITQERGKKVGKQIMPEGKVKKEKRNLICLVYYGTSDRYSGILRGVWKVFLKGCVSRLLCEHSLSGIV